MNLLNWNCQGLTGPLSRAWGAALLAAGLVSAAAAPGTVTTSISPTGTVPVGGTITVTLRISGYTDTTEIDGYNFRVTYPASVYSVVAGSLRVNDAPGASENWLRLAPQDAIGTSSMPVNDFTLAPAATSSSGVLDVSVADLRLTSTRGTRAADGFLYSFDLQGTNAGAGPIVPSAGAGGTVLFNSDLSPVGVPSFTGAVGSVGTIVRVTAFERRSASQFWLRFTGDPNTTYRVEWSDNLQTWNNLGPAVPSVPVPGQFEYLDTSATPPHRFYRVTSP